MLKPVDQIATDLRELSQQIYLLADAVHQVAVASPSPAHDVPRRPALKDPFHPAFKDAAERAHQQAKQYATAPTTARARSREAACSAERRQFLADLIQDVDDAISEEVLAERMEGAGYQISYLQLLADLEALEDAGVACPMPGTRWTWVGPL